MHDSKEDIKLKTAFYIRVSTDEQSEKYGEDLQLTKLRAMVDAKDNLLQPEEKYIYIEEISGTIPILERPKFSKLVEDVVRTSENEKPFDVVLVYKIDRLARSLKILLDTIEFFENNHLKLVSSQESIDTSTSFGKAMLGIIGVIAELELAVIKERTHSGKLEAIKQGKLMGKAPYGFNKDIDKRPIINKPEAEYVKRIFDDFTNKRLTIQEIARELRNEKVLVPKYSNLGGKIPDKPNKNTKNKMWYWQPATISILLKDEIYIGNYYYNKSRNSKDLPKDEWELSPYKVEPIIDLNTFNKAKILLDRNRELRVSNTADHVHLLRSLLKCDHCYNEKIDKGIASTWHGTSKKYGNKQKSHYYVCRRKNVSKGQIRCNTLPLPAAEIEAFIVDYIFELLENPRSVLEYQAKLDSSKLETKKLKSKEKTYIKLINAIPNKVRNLREQHEIGLITIKELEASIAENKNDANNYENELSIVQMKLAENTTRETYGKALNVFRYEYKDKLQEIKNDRQALFNLIHLLVDEIVVFSRPVTDADRVAGRKTDEQFIPNGLRIELKLPQEFLKEQVELNVKSVREKSEFGAKNSVW